MSQQVYMSGVLSATINLWQAEVEALPPRKREKWHKSCRDGQGVYRQTRYYNGNFQVKVRPDTSKGKLLLPESGWAPVVAIDGVVSRGQLVDSYGEDVIARIESDRGERFEAELARGLIDPQYQHAAEEAFQGGIVAADNALRRTMAENHTGNHYRNKAIGVPTSAGQPVRA